GDAEGGAEAVEQAVVILVAADAEHLDIAVPPELAPLGVDAEAVADGKLPHHGGAVAIHLGGGEAVAVLAEIDVVALDGEVGVELPADDALDQVALVIEVAAPGLEAAVVAAEVEPGGALGAGPLGHGEGGAEYRQGQSCGQ